MSNEKQYIFGIILFYLIQRLSELVLNKTNERFLIENFDAIEIDPDDSFRMRAFHSLWFIALIGESLWHGKLINGELATFAFIILIIAMLIRFHTISLLRELWTIKIYSLSPRPIIKEGLYKIIRHPNYLAVILELLFIPILLGCYFTALFFSLGNLWILSKRIKLEESELETNPDYNQEMKNKKKLIPFIY